MQNVNNQDDLIQYFRNKRPQFTQDMSDLDVYTYGKNLLFESQGVEVPDYEPPANKIEPEQNAPMLSNRYQDVDVSPDASKGFLESVYQIGLSGASEMFTDSGIPILGISPEFFRKSYNQSLVGLAYQATYGKPKYDIGDYDPGWGAEVGSFITGMASPMEIALYVSGAGLGAKAAQASTAVAKATGVKSLVKTAAPKNKLLAKQLVESGIQDGTAFGMISSAYAATASAANQKSEKGSIDVSQVMSDAGDGFLESFLIGFPAGVVGRGLLGSKYAMKVNAAKEGGETLSASQKALYGLPGQASVETVAFATLPSFYKEIGLNNFKDYPMIGSDEWFTNVAADGSMVASLFAGSKILSKYNMSKVAAKIEDINIEEGQMNNDMLVRVRQNLKNPELSREVIEELNLQDVNLFDDIKSLKDFKERSAKLEKIANKYTDEQIQGNKVSKEDARWMAEDGARTLNETRIILDSVAKDNVKLKSAFESMTDKPLTDKQFSTMKNDLNTSIGQIVDVFDDVNYQLTGIPKTDVQQQSLFQKTTKGDIEPVKPVSEKKIKLIEDTQAKYKSFVKQPKKKVSALQSRQITEFVATRAGIKNPAKFKLNDPNTTQADINRFSKQLDIDSSKNLMKLSNKANELRTMARVDKLKDTVLSKTQSNKVLTALGVPNGDIVRANSRQLAEFEYAIKEPAKDIPVDNEQYLFDAKVESDSSKFKKIKKLEGIMSGIAKSFIPVWEVVEMLGEKVLSKKLLTRASIESEHYAKFNAFQDKFNSLYRVNKIELNNVKKSLYLMDIERYLERLNKNILKPYERKFIKNTFESDYVIVEKDKFKFNNKKYKRVIDAVKKDKDGKPATREAEVALMWDDYRQYNKDAYYTAVKAAFKSEAEYKQFLENHPINWIEDNVYLTRTTTKQFRELFDESNGGKYYHKLVEEPKNKLAKRLAQEKYKKKDVTKEQIAEFDEIARMEVEASINDMFKFSRAKATSSALKTRHIKLPEIIEINGKNVKVYETDFNSYIQPYAAGMSKFLANAEMFPDMVKLKDTNIKGRQTEALIGSLKLKNKQWGNWLEVQIDKELGINKRLYGDNGVFVTGANSLAGIYSKTALGFITAGAKNLFLGQNINMSSFYLRDYMRGLVLSMSKDFRNDVRMTLDTSVGVGHITDIRTNKIWDAMFALGGMKPTENANRIIAIASAKYDAARLVKILQSSGSSEKAIRNATDRLKEFYHMSDRQVSLFKKYGLNGVDGHSFKDSFEASKIKRELEVMSNQINTYAHINTQGSAQGLFMPDYWDKGMVKPMLLFKKMAYQFNRNQLRNFQLAKKNNDYIKIAMMGLAPIATGQALISMYSYLLQSNVPEENSNWDTYMKTLLVRGETFGLATDVLRMMDGEGADMTVYPALYEWGKAFVTALRAPIEGTKTKSQSLEDLLKNTSSAYRAYLSNIRKRGEKNALNKGSSKYRALYYEFKNEVMPDGPDFGDRIATTKDPFYRELKEVFLMGTPDEAARQYAISVYGIATEYYRNDVDKNGEHTKYRGPNGYSKAIKEAVKQVKASITRMNPNILSPVKKKPVETAKWVKWLNKDEKRGKVYMYELRKLEGQYFTKVDEMEKLIHKYLRDPEAVKLIKKALK
mgnify:FL=1|tara:strand:- start:6433 stop:11298 length:4866 start_codon:yes stop_codon:yes gene_type:complete